MFDIFGEFDSVEELNEAAAGLLRENDTKNLVVLARENGIPEDFAALYGAGELPVLADAALAALGKIDTELPEAVTRYGETAECVAEYIKSLCDRDSFAAMVRRKGRSLLQCLALMESEARSRVKEKTGCQCVCISPSAGYKMIRDYYEGGCEK